MPDSPAGCGLAIPCVGELAKRLAAVSGLNIWARSKEVLLCIPLREAALQAFTNVHVLVIPAAILADELLARNADGYHAKLNFGVEAAADACERSADSDVVLLDLTSFATMPKIFDNVFWP